MKKDKYITDKVFEKECSPRKLYHRPKLTIYGDIRKLTGNKGNSGGDGSSQKSRL